MDTSNIIKEFGLPLIALIDQINKSIALLKSHTHQHSLKRKCIRIHPHIFMTLEVESRNANCWPGILERSNPRKKLPNTHERVMIIDFLKVNRLTLTSCLLFTSLCQSNHPNTCKGKYTEIDKKQIPYKPLM